MKTLRYSFAFPLMLIMALAFALPGCTKKTSPAGVKVKQPFSGNAYESNNRFFRGTGQGVSVKQNIARSKADLDAKNQLAAQVGTNIKAVSDQYLGQTENANAADVADKFQTLVREVMSTELADLRKIGEETYFNETTKDYTQYVAYEIKKAAMFRFMKKQARTNAKISEQELKVMDEILDQQIKLAEAEGE
ncbi:MAG: hypothetical protein IT229_13255 [Flavobacteriales bacterium]|nr:hypothetical protein [Flavobacteriales bacterium]